MYVGLLKRKNKLPGFATFQHATLAAAIMALDERMNEITEQIEEANIVEVDTNKVIVSLRTIK
jgi:hypothetical protein